MKKLFMLGLVALLLVVSQKLFAEDKVLAILNGENITEEQVLKAAFERWITTINEGKVYEIKKNALDELIEDKLLASDAKTKGVAVEALIKQLQDKAAKPDEAAARAIYEMQKKRFGDKTFDDIKGMIMNQLAAQQKQMAVMDHINTLKKNAKLTVNLKRPRVTVSVDDDPSQGTKGAPITLIEFSDFQCPYCKKTRPTLERLLNEYKGKINYVFRDFPLSFHDQAKVAANAATCAGEQGKYWEFNKLLWEKQGKTMGGEIFNIATTVGVNNDKFKACVESKKYFSEIDKDQSDGDKAGVSGTPAYFINGIFLNGARPYEDFKEIIDEELAVKK